MISRDGLLVPDERTNAPPIPTEYQRHLFPSRTGDLPFAGEERVHVVNLAISTIIAENHLTGAIRTIWQDYSVRLRTNPKETSKAIENAPVKFVFDKQILGSPAAPTNPSVVYRPSSTTMGTVSLAYTESEFNRTEVQLLKGDDIVASSRSEWRVVSDRARTFIGDIYWGSEYDNPASSFPVTISFAVDNQNSLRAPLTLESVSFSLDDIKKPLKFHEQRTGDELRLKSLSAEFSSTISGEITTVNTSQIARYSTL
jgi:hypothetical protein